MSGARPAGGASPSSRTLLCYVVIFAGSNHAVIISKHIITIFITAISITVTITVTITTTIICVIIIYSPLARLT